MRALYVTPLKAPDDPVPSGDRTIARAHEAILRHVGFEIIKPQAFSSFMSVPDAARMHAIHEMAQDEIARLAKSDVKPDLIFTYHCHYKAPDLLGPALARSLSIPYVIVEGSHAGKRAQGPWEFWHQQSERALKEADLHLLINPQDHEGLLACTQPERIHPWPVPIDDTAWPIMPRWSQRALVHCLAVAMMREGDKLASYRLLAEAFHQLARDDWHLTLVGDGPARDQVLALFAPFGERVSWRGQLHGMALADAYADADVLVWPAVNEALGMVFLEAALQACPSLAGNEGGVSTIVHDGVTGLLAPPRDATAFAERLSFLLAHPDELQRLGDGARIMAQQAGIEQASARLRAALSDLGLQL